MIRRIFYCLALWLMMVAGGVHAIGVPLPQALFCPGPLCDESGPERILSFDVQAAINLDGSMNVTERIRILTHGELLQHGIYRTLPLLWNRHDGNRVQARYQVLQVLRDGQAEFYQSQADDNLLRVNIGTPENRLPPGVHDYEIHYQVINPFSRYKSGDELYWNVTGNDWPFTIDFARFSLSLPEAGGIDVPSEHDPRIGGVDYYTGGNKNRGGDAEILYDDSVVTTAPLPPFHGLTVVYTWPRSVLPPLDVEASPFPVSSLVHSLLPQYAYIGFWAPCALLLFYFLSMLLTRPKSCETTAENGEHLPGGMSPGYMRYVFKRHCDDVVLAVEVLNTVLKRAINLESEPAPARAQSLHVISGRAPVGAQMWDADCLLRDALFNDDQRPIVLRGEHCTRLSKARELLSTFYAGTRDKLLYRSGWPIFWGHVATLLTFLICTIRYDLNEMFKVFVVYLCSLPFLYLFVQIVTRLAPLRRGGKRTKMFAALGAAVVFQLLLSLTICWLMGGIDFLLLPAGFAGALIGCQLICYLHYFLMPLYTQEGEDLLALIASARLRLDESLARPETLAPDAESLHELNQRMLPYALALGRGAQWTAAVERCARLLGDEALHVAQANEQYVALFYNLCAAVMTESEAIAHRCRAPISQAAA